MAFRHLDIEIPAQSPFQNCKLGREKYATALTNIILNYPDGFVLAVNNKWGTGKTTFVKMWEQSLKNADFATIYFNAWENDFEDNPLTAFVAELQIINKKGKDKFNTVVKNAALISKNVAPAVLKSLISKYVDSDTLVNLISDASKSIFEIFEDDIKEYTKRKESITDFKKCLSEFVANESRGKPLVFIIDELDRCRPNYAVLLLEQIKHFFSVPNIIFILSIDKVQLGNAIRGVYGSEKLDANEYLRRFIDIEYSIPEPDTEIFFDYLYDYFKFDTFFRAVERSRYSELQYDKDNFIRTSKSLISKLTLRQQEKILSHTRIALRTLNYNNYLLPTIFVFLSYSKVIFPDFYYNLSSRHLTLAESQEEFYSIVRSFINEKSKHLFVQIEGYLLQLYENHISETPRTSIFIERDTHDNKYKLNIDSKIDNALLLAMLSNDRFNLSYSRITLSYLLNKLDLIEDIKVN